MSKTAYQDVERRFAEIVDLSSGVEILSWDQEVMMPPGGAETRAQTMATLQGVIHERMTSPDLVSTVRTAQRGRAKLTPRQRRGLELVRRSVDKATCVPADLARELSLAQSRGLEAWRVARTNSDFGAFVPALETIVDLVRRKAQLRAGKNGALYDALLDDYEPGMTTERLDELLDELEAITVPLVRKVVQSDVRVDVRPFVGKFKIDAQRDFARQVSEAMGIRFDQGRLDLSTHPFCGGTGPGDVRMTSRYDENDMRGGLFGVIHESGHGLYEQGRDPNKRRTPLGGAISMGIHESQSRLWENNVARGKPFWEAWYDRFIDAHPKLRKFDVDAIWRAANIVEPSMIRVEADELTYNLHIILRTRIERDLISGEIDVTDLPARWNESMQSMLGITPADDAEGVLQDIHWAMGAIGYFPTYSLGNLYAAQFMEAARSSIRGLDRKIAKGDMLTLRTWLADNIHRHDQTFTAEKIVKRVTGKPLGTEAFARHIRKKVKAIYG